MGLYHYCGFEKGLSILKYKNIRLSDISKSNDFRELELFFPHLHNAILEQYEQAPFPFKYFESCDLDAMRSLVLESHRRWRIYLDRGDFANFVLCFSEKNDCLSQWRGYADDAKGLCIGFTRKTLEDFCASTKGVLTLEKVTYVSDKTLKETISKIASSILENLKTLRQRIVDEITHDDADRDTDISLSYHFDDIIQQAYTKSLKYKFIHFAEEKEWRIYFSHYPYKLPRLPNRNSKKLMPDLELFAETGRFLHDRIDFRWTENDLIPYYPLQFDEFHELPVKEVWIGPKSNVRSIDLGLFLKKYGYKQVDINYSAITYR